MRKRSKLKGIESLKSQIREHQQKIAEEKDKPIPNIGRIKHWEKELRVFENNILKLEQQLKRRRR